MPTFDVRHSLTFDVQFDVVDGILQKRVVSYIIYDAPHSTFNALEFAHSIKVMFLTHTTRDHRHSPLVFQTSIPHDETNHFHTSLFHTFATFMLSANQSLQHVALLRCQSNHRFFLSDSQLCPMCSPGSNFVISFLFVIAFLFSTLLATLNTLIYVFCLFPKFHLICLAHLFQRFIFLRKYGGNDFFENHRKTCQLMKIFNYPKWFKVVGQCHLFGLAFGGCRIVIGRAGSLPRCASV